MMAPPLVCYRDDFCLITNLSSLRNFFLRSLGPRGSLTMFQSSGGHLTVTNCSERVLKCLEIDNTKDPCTEAILMAAKGFLEDVGDGGTVLTSLICDLTALSAQTRRPGESTDLLREVMELCLAKYEHTLDLSSSCEMLALAKSVLSSKCHVTKSNVEPLALAVVRGFLESMPSSNSQESVRPLKVKLVTHGLSRGFTLEDGFLHCLSGGPTDADAVKKFLSFHDRRPFKTLILNVQLREELKEMEEMVDIVGEYDGSLRPHKKIASETHFQRILSHCSTHNIKILLNQKVVEEHFVRMCQKNGILCLDRLGNEGVDSLCSLTQTVPAASMNCGADISASHGCVDEVTVKRFGEKDYVQLRKGSVPAPTLMIGHYTEESGQDLKALCDRAASGLYGILKHPKVLPGAGCFEASMTKELISKGKMESLPSSSRRVLLEASQVFARLALATVKVDEGIGYTHAAKGHLWVFNDDARTPRKCSCGLLNEKDHHLSQYISLRSSENANYGHVSGLGEERSDIELGAEVILGKISSSSIIDSSYVKKRQYLTALEVSSSLASIGGVIVKG